MLIKGKIFFCIYLSSILNSILFLYTNLNQNMIVSYVIVITNIDTENETAVLLQENSINGIIA